MTGQPPFPGGTSKEKIHRHRKDRPEPLAPSFPTCRRGSSPWSSD
ncbi:MAG: hypothetical protein U0736_04415 [Gemmataceae bacterium]